MLNSNYSIDEFINKKNFEKIIFTAGPASLAKENISGLRPCFGRGDNDYEILEKRVLKNLKELSGHKEIIRMQGSASLAIEIMILNFLYGNILVIDTGYYSKRLSDIISNSRSRFSKNNINIKIINWKDLNSLEGNYDWVLSCYTETSCGLKLPMEVLFKLSKRLSAKLMLDATASIGLEVNHHLADVIAFSSCKGLFGLTGASFIAFNEFPKNKVDSFYLNFANHFHRKMTGPYHSIASMDLILENYNYFQKSVLNNKKKFIEKFREFLVYPDDYQPNLCTYVSCKIKANDDRAILYHPRSNFGGSVVCHLGEIHLGTSAKGNIIDALEPDL